MSCVDKRLRKTTECRRVFLRKILFSAECPTYNFPSDMSDGLVCMGWAQRCETLAESLHCGHLGKEKS